MKAQSIGRLAASCSLCLMPSAQAEGSDGTGSAGAQDTVAVLAPPPAFAVAVDYSTRQITYGLVDNRDPIVTTEASVEWRGVSLESALIFDTTKWGRSHGGYGNRQGAYQELDLEPGYTYALSPERLELLPTTVELSASYLYEHHPPVRKTRGEANPKTQFINVGAALPELWLTPAFSAELDIDNERGALYLAGEIGHTFTLVKAAGVRETDPLALALGAGAGLGNPKRNTFDAGFDAWAFKDIWVSAALEWHLTDQVTFAPYVAVHEQLHRRLREAARAYLDGETHSSAQVIGGLRLAACF